MNRFIYEPEVYLIARQEIVTDYKSISTPSLDDFISDFVAEGWQTDTTKAAEKLCEVGGRVCYMSFSKPRPGGNAAYLKHILEVGHGSVIEHATWSFIITGVSRTFTHELVRHRAGWAYSQLSQRYVDESNTQFVVPHDLRREVMIAQQVDAFVVKGNSIEEAVNLAHANHSLLPRDRFNEMLDAGRQWIDSMMTANGDYISLSEHLNNKFDPIYEKCSNCGGTGRPDPLEDVGVCPKCSGKKRLLTGGIVDATARRKAARQAARSVLPNATETKIVVTANARAIRHFVEMRASRHAEPEIRKVAAAILKILQTEAPNLFGDYTLVELEDGTFEANTKYRKV